MTWLGLRARILLALVLVAAAACAALTVTTTRWAAADYERQLEDRVSGATQVDLQRVAEALEARPGALTLDQLSPTALPGAAGVDAEGLIIPVPSKGATIDLSLADQYSHWNGSDAIRRIPQCLQPQQAQILDDLSEGESQVWTEHCGELVLGFGATRPSEQGARYAWLVVLVLTPNQGFDSLVSPVPELQQTLVTNSVGIILGAALVAVALAAMVIRPLNRSRDMAEAVAAGQADVRLPVRGRDSVARMSAAVNTMADTLTDQISELERANESQRRFVSDVAHELRTPTAALLAAAEALEHPETRDQAAALVAPQLRRLASLTEDLLEISRIDAGRAELLNSRIDLTDLVHEVVDNCGDPASVRLVGPRPLEVTTDPIRLRVVVRNLVANALQHGAPPVTIAASCSDGQVRVSVTDEGSGVPSALRDHVFDRFVRGDEARHGSSSGLGLAIAAENVRLLGGTLTLEADGRTFLLSLPGGDAPAGTT